MSTNDFLKYLSVALASAVKFVGGPLTGAALGLYWLETALCTVIGMMFSVVVVTYVGKAIQVLILRWRKTTPRRFSSSNRRAVRIWKRFGIVGIAVLTPILLTPIGGTVLAVAFKVPPQRIFFWMLISGSVWGLFFSYLAYRLIFIQLWFK